MFTVIKRWFTSKETTTSPVPVSPVVPSAPKVVAAAGGRGLYWPRARHQSAAHHPGSSSTIALFSHSQPA